MLVSSSPVDGSIEQTGTYLDDVTARSSSLVEVASFESVDQFFKVGLHMSAPGPTLGIRHLRVECRWLVSYVEQLQSRQAQQLELAWHLQVVLAGSWCMLMMIRRRLRKVDINTASAGTECLTRISTGSETLHSQLVLNASQPRCMTAMHLLRILLLSGAGRRSPLLEQSSRC